MLWSRGALPVTKGLNSDALPKLELIHHTQNFKPTVVKAVERRAPGVKSTHPPQLKDIQMTRQNPNLLSKQKKLR